MPAKKPAVSS